MTNRLYSLNQPAFAAYDTTDWQVGLTKLEYFTAMAMQGMLSNPIYNISAIS